MIKSAALGLAIAALIGASAPTPSLGAASGKKQTLGYVITLWDTAIYESRFAEECPEGLVMGNDEIWWRGLPRAEKDKFTNKGLTQPVDRKNTAMYRGPGGKDVCWNPTVVKDPPLKVIKGKTSYGFDLDGDEKGDGTAKSCKHETFSSPEGAQGDRVGVDNQMYRILGCHYGWRRNGVLDSYDDEERRNSGRGVVLLEVTGVDDPQNSANVTVNFYRAIDPFSVDAAGKILPYGSYRIDLNGDKPRYAVPIKGKIENGVLITEPTDFSVPFDGNNTVAEVRMRDAKLSLDLKLADGKVKGLLGGYYDFDKWWEYMMKIEFLVATGDWSCPALYEASKRLADGYPDKDGNCTAISSAFKVEAIPAYVIHQNQTADAR